MREATIGNDGVGREAQKDPPTAPPTALWDRICGQAKDLSIMGTLARIRLAEPDIDGIFNDAKAVGMSIAVSHQGETIYERHLGYRDVENKIPADSNTIYPINSLTKAVVAFCIAQAQLDGKLSFNDTVKSHLPEFQHPVSVIEKETTIMDLLSHRSGVKENFTMWLGSDNNVLLEKRELFSAFYKCPGDAKEFRNSFNYNNFGYAIVGEILKKVYGFERNDYMALGKIFDKIFVAHHLQSMATSWDQDPDKNTAKPYIVGADGTKIQIPLSGISEGSIMEAAGGIKSTVTNLLAFYKALLNSYDISTDTNTDLTTSPNASSNQHPGFKHCQDLFLPQTFMPGSESTYTAGWIHSPTPDIFGHLSRNRLFEGLPLPASNNHSVGLSFSHNGSTPGSSTVVHLVPNTNTVILILQNSTSTNDTADLISQLLLQAIFPPDRSNIVDIPSLGREVSERTKAYLSNLLKTKLSQAPQDQPPPNNSAYTGTYRYKGSQSLTFDIHIFEDNHSLRFQLSRDTQSFSLRHLEGDEFIWDVTYDELARKGRLLEVVEDGYYLFRFGRGGGGKRGDGAGEMKELRWNWCGDGEEGVFLRFENRYEDEDGSDDGDSEDWEMNNCQQWCLCF